MAHESPAFLRNQRQLGTAETTARLTGQLLGPSQLYQHNKGIFYISSSNKKVLDLLTLHKQHNKKNEKNAYLLFLCDWSWQNKWQAKYCCFFLICMNRGCLLKARKIPTWQHEMKISLHLINLHQILASPILAGNNWTKSCCNIQISIWQ